MKKKTECVYILVFDFDKYIYTLRSKENWIRLYSTFRLWQIGVHINIYLNRCIYKYIFVDGNIGRLNQSLHGIYLSQKKQFLET